MSGSPGGPAPMAAAEERSLLSGLSQELALMVPIVEGLSGLVMDHAIQADAAARPRILAQAQAVDDLNQRLQALVDLTRAVAAGTAPEAALDAVRLADVAARLRLASAGERSQPATPARGSGDLMLFDQP